MSRSALPRVSNSTSSVPSRNGHNGGLGLNANSKPAGATPHGASSEVNDIFLRMLPSVRTHAQIVFRRLRDQEREEAVAEATAAALLIIHAACRNGRAHRLKPSSVATYAALHAKNGGHVGGSADSRGDAMSRNAQRLHGFSVIGLSRGGTPIYNCMNDPTRPVWKQVLQEDHRTCPADLAAFRIDLSQFMAQQSDRTRTLLGLLAEGHRQVDIAERMGLTPAALCQRRKRAGEDWSRMQNGAANLLRSRGPET